MTKAYIWLSQWCRGNEALKTNTFLKDIIYQITSSTKVTKVHKNQMQNFQFEDLRERRTWRESPKHDKV